MHSAADECGWRAYPVKAGYIRVNDVAPEWYAEADVYEALVNSIVEKEIAAATHFKVRGWGWHTWNGNSIEVDIEAFRARCHEIEQSHPGFICDPEPAIAEYLAAIGVMEKEA